MSLLDKMKKAGSIKSETLDKSDFLKNKDLVPTELPILNIAFSADVDGGLSTGLTVLAGESKMFKSLLGLYCMKSYMNLYTDSVSLFYDSEFGITTEYLENNGIDTSRVIHIPIKNVEELKFDIVKRLEAIERGDKVFIFMDSIGNLASNKEVEDALSEKSVADMSRAKALKSLFRIITPHLTLKNIPCIAINHIYKEIGTMYPKSIIGGGTGIYYSANQIFIISKSQEKDGTELLGYNFTINIEKSRSVREKAKLTFTVLYDGGIQKYSGLMDIALDGGFVVKPSNGWYSYVDPDSGELGGKLRLSQTTGEDFWKPILENPEFKKFVKSKFGVSHAKLVAENDLDDKTNFEENLEEESDG